MFFQQGFDCFSHFFSPFRRKRNWNRLFRLKTACGFPKKVKNIFFFPVEVPAFRLYLIRILFFAPMLASVYNDHPAVRKGLFRESAGHISNATDGDRAGRRSQPGGCTFPHRDRTLRAHYARVRVPDPVRVAGRPSHLRDEDRREFAGRAVPCDDGEARAGSVCGETVSLDANVRMEGPFRGQGTDVSCRAKRHLCH